MVIDRIQNGKLYVGMHHRLAQGLDYLRTMDLSKLADGKHEIDGKDLYLILGSAQTKPADQGKWEAHRIYADIQYVIQGTERMGWAPLEAMKISKPYDEADDYLLCEGDAGSFVDVSEGNFCIFLPEDAHMPGLAAGRPAMVRKAVLKVRL
ncbi:MAG: YhcH/YjgK/YiaL family protein [Phycisphaerales bacterium]|jgi:YhcH/YjgK/YiaL family protein|nr:YhcH/YjgK/YiaL family protein [Phycisphaerales bacterium]